MFWILQKIIHFFQMIRVFYWMSTLSVIRSYIQVKSFKRSLSNWAFSVCKFLDVKMQKIPSQHEIRTDKTIFLFNHRSQADFFIHPLILGGTANFLARQQVAFMFGIISLFVTKIIWFFNRSGHINIEKQFCRVKKGLTNGWIKNMCKVHVHVSSYTPKDTECMKAHRFQNKRQGEESLMYVFDKIKYAYSRQIPVQFIMTFGNEKAFNEKRIKISYGQRITYKIGKVIDPKDYSEAKEFVNATVSEFSRFFDETYQDTISGKQFEDTTEKLYDVVEFKKQ